MNTQTVTPAVSERALELFRNELGKRGIKYEIRRN